jgi:hypothetical protein
MKGIKITALVLGLIAVGLFCYKYYYGLEIRLVEISSGSIAIQNKGSRTVIFSGKEIGIGTSGYSVGLSTDGKIVTVKKDGVVIKSLPATNSSLNVKLN